MRTTMLCSLGYFLCSPHLRSHRLTKVPRARRIVLLHLQQRVKFYRMIHQRGNSKQQSRHPPLHSLARRRSNREAASVRSRLLSPHLLLDNNSLLQSSKNVGRRTDGVQHSRQQHICRTTGQTRRAHWEGRSQFLGPKSRI